MTLSHRIVGSGPQKVLVLHGWLGDHGVFAPMFPSLDGSAFTYAFVDYRGYGGNRGSGGPYTMATIAADAIAIADALGWARFHVVGHSMGGSAAQLVCVRVPDRVKSAVCLTPVPASGVPMEGEQQALFSGAAAADGNRRAIIDFSTGLRLPGAWLDHMVAESRRTSDEAAFAAYFDAWSGTNFSAEADGLTTPMLVAVGEHDLALTPDVMRATFMRWYPNATLTVIPNAGHYPMQEVPVYLAGLIEAHVRTHG